MSRETSPHLGKKSLQWVQLDSREFLERQAQLLEELSMLIDTSLGIATHLQQYRRYLLEQESRDLELT